MSGVGEPRVSVCPLGVPPPAGVRASGDAAPLGLPECPTVLLRLVPGVPAEARSRLSGAWPCLPELIITSGGENVAPKPIEDAVRKELPIVSCAMLIGDQRKFLSTLVTLKVCLGPGPSGSHAQPGHIWHGRGAPGARVGPPAPVGAVDGTGPGVAESRSAAAFLSSAGAWPPGRRPPGARSLSHLRAPRLQHDGATALSR